MDDSIISKLREKISQKEVITQNDIDYFYSILRRFHRINFDMPTPVITMSGKNIPPLYFVKQMFLYSLFNEPKNIRDDGEFHYVHRVAEPLETYGVLSKYFVINDVGKISLDATPSYRRIYHHAIWGNSPGISEYHDICSYCGADNGPVGEYRNGFDCCCCGGN